jgi:hypothetical protein
MMVHILIIIPTVKASTCRCVTFILQQSNISCHNVVVGYFYTQEEESLYHTGVNGKKYWTTNRQHQGFTLRRKS